MPAAKSSKGQRPNGLPNNERIQKRSRQGCSRCRSHRKKCDETKPQCGRCVSMGTPCYYDMQLRWGGRCFPKSFRKQVEGVARVGNAKEFVYGLQSQVEPPRPAPRAPAASEKAGATKAVTEVAEPPRPSSAPSAPGISLESWPILLGDEAPRIYRFLFHHYVQETTRLTAPSSYARLQICRTIVPLALQRPSLLLAMMATAAQHLRFISTLDNIDRDMDNLVATIKTQSLRILRSRQQALRNTTTEYDAALATARTLYQAEVMFGLDAESWRPHLETAQTIVEAAQGPAAPALSSVDFLSSWYNNAEALACVSPVGFLGGKHRLHNPQVQFDLFGGVASDVPDLLREVGALLAECRRQSRQRDAGDDEFADGARLSHDDILTEAEELVRTINARLERDSVLDSLGRGGSGDGDARSSSSLSSADIHDYALTNASFLHTALLHINGGVRKLPPSSAEVQHSVQRIVWCAENMQSAPTTPSPRVLMMTPLFAAGVWGSQAARQDVKTAMEGMCRWMPTQNAVQATSILDKLCRLPDNAEHDTWSYLERQNPGYMPY